MRINERFFKLRRSAARSFVKLYANENSGVSVMSETTRVPEEKIIQILSSALC